MPNFATENDLQGGNVEMNGEEEIEENCFICFRRYHQQKLERLYNSNQGRQCNKPTNKSVPHSSTAPLKCQLAVVFLLRKVLGIDSNAIVGILEKAAGVNPSDWGIKLCSSCHVLFREAEFVHRRLLKLQADFEVLVKEIRELVVLSAKKGKDEVSFEQVGSSKRGKNQRKKSGRPPKQKGHTENAEISVNDKGEGNVADKIRTLFVDAWENGEGLERSLPKVLFSTAGTQSVLDGVHTTQPIQVKIIQSRHNDVSVRLLKTTTARFCNIVGSSSSSAAVIYSVPEAENVDVISEKNIPVLNREVISSQIDIKRELNEDINDILIDAEECYYENDGVEDMPSPLPLACNDENDEIPNTAAAPVKDNWNRAAAKRTRRKRGDDDISDSEDFDGDDKDSDYQPETEVPKPKKDRRFTRKKPNIKENMRRKRLRTLKAASFGKVAVGVNIEPVAVKGETGPSYACPQEGCELAFLQKLDCHAHMLRDHYQDPLPYHCHVCDSKRFQVEATLRKHMVRFHRGARTPYDEDFNPELHSAEKLISVVEADQVWNSFVNESKADGARESEHSSDDEGVPGVPSFPDEVLEKFRDDKDGKEFRCRHSPCKRKFTNEMLRDGHEKRIHLGIEKPFQCEHCKKDFLRRTKLLTHMALAHYSNQYSCDHCGSRFADKVLLAGHIGRAHLGEKHPFKCTSCSRQFARRTKMDMHMYKVHGIPLPSKPTKRKIPARAIPVPKIIPSKAKKVLDGEQGGLELKKCWICYSTEGKPMLFETLEDLKEHNEQKHIVEGVEKPFKCPVQNCYKEYRTHGKLDCHMVNLHNGEINDTDPKEFPCTHCNETFHRNYLLDAHLAKQHDASMYMCNFCAKQFRTQRYLDDHQRQTHYKELSIDPFKCKRCGKVMNTQKSLDHHIKMIHTKETPFNCTIPGCGFGTMYPSALKVHMNIKHSNRKNAICPICSRTFAAQFYLNRHMRIHTGEKPYKCLTCSKLFSDMPTYNRHVEAHLGKVHKCPLESCGKEYNTRHAYRVHLKLHQRKGIDVEVPNFRNRPLLPVVEDDGGKEKVSEGSTNREETFAESTFEEADNSRVVFGENEARKLN